MTKNRKDEGKTSEKNTPLGEVHPNPNKTETPAQDDSQKGYHGSQDTSTVDPEELARRDIKERQVERE